MIENLIDRIRSLPPLPKSLGQINSICADPNSAIGDLAKVKEDISTQLFLDAIEGL